MSKRASIRRYNKKVKKENPIKKQMREADNEGYEYAILVSEYVLKKHFNFKDKKLSNLKDKVVKESKICYREENSFVVSLYKSKFIERLPKNILEETDNIYREMYVTRRNDIFFTVCGLIASILYSDYSFGYTKTHKGKLDMYIEYIINEYIKINLSPDTMSVDFYKKSLTFFKKSDTF